MYYQEKLISDEIKKMTPVMGRQNAERLLKTYLLADEETRKRIIEMVDILKAAVNSDKELRDTVLIEPPEREVISGEIKLGHVNYGRKRLFPLLIKAESLLTHIGIFGSSGYGKTNVSFMLAKSLAEMNIPVIIFDFSKRNYRDLLQTELRDRIEVYTIGRDVSPFRFNPLKPPKDITASQWIKEFASIFDHAYWLLGGGQHIIMMAMNDLYENKQNPRLADLKDAVEILSHSHGSSRERNWVATAMRPLESLCFREMNDVFDTDFSDLSQLFSPGKITIFELDALSTNDKTFFIEIVLQWIRDWMLAGKSREKLAGAIILEEAHHVLNREKSKKLGSETVIDLLFREVRELGLGIIYIDQHPSLVSYPAMGNTSTHIYMNLGLDTKQSSDIMDAANMLGLDYNEEGSYLRRLPVGHGFMLARNSEFSKPFLAEFEKLEIEKGKITDKDVVELMRDKIKTIGRANVDVDFDVNGLNESEMKIITAIGTGKGLYTSQLYKALKMSGSTFNDNMKLLLKLGLVDQKGVKVKKTKAVYYFLTDIGEGVFNKIEKTAPRQEKMDKKHIIWKFESSGYEVGQAADSGGLVMLKKGDKELKLSFITNYDRDPIYRALHNNGYYICANEALKNVLLQQACRYAKKKGGMKIFVQLADEFMGTGAFENIYL